MSDNGMQSKPAKNWPEDEFGRQEVLVYLWIPVLILIVGLLAAFVFPGIAWPNKKTSNIVIVYCAQDQTYAEPILRRFEDATGIRVRAVYDSEAVKTVGLANRLLAERHHPQCDVFWGNEEMRTRQLAAFHVWRETNGFFSFGARVRCLVLNTNLLPPANAPSRPDVPLIPVSLLELTNADWRGKVAIAFPQFGTTATHFHVLRQHWGEPLWRQWCHGLLANEAKILDGNSTVVNMVGRGEAWIGLTDTDDVVAGQRAGLPVTRGPDLAETLLFIPNTIGIVRAPPHPQNAQELADYLQRPQTAKQLCEVGAIQYVSIPMLGRQVLRPDWQRLLEELDSTTETLNTVFLR